MKEKILLSGDIAEFDPIFSVALLTGVRMTKIQGTGNASIENKNICVSGDEKKVKKLGCTYTFSNFTSPGVGTLTIENLAPSQESNYSTINGKKILKQGKGEKFNAKFSVDVKAVDPSNGAQDPNVQYFGFGQFKSNNTKGETE